MPPRPTSHPRIPHSRIAEQLRAQIVDGRWSPGGRLPTRVELEKRFAASSATVQKALDKLTLAGFIVPRGRHGTFVADRPPHRHRLGVVFADDPARAARWPRMWQALEMEARRQAADDPASLQIYYDAGDPAAPGQQQLCADLAAHRLAGVFLATITEAMAPLLELVQQQGIAAAALTGDPPPAGLVHLRLLPYLGKALDRLQAEGRKRIGLINSFLRGDYEQAWRKMLEDRGLEYEPYRAVSVSPFDPEPAQATAYFMMQQAPSRRPDALIVTDDYLVEKVTAGVLDSGGKAPEQVHIIAHCNFPLPAASSVAVTRLGYDLPAALRQTLLLLTAQAAGEQQQVRQLTIMPVFEEELPAPPPVQRPWRTALATTRSAAGLAAGRRITQPGPSPAD